jgi:hypothetical protein
VGTSRSCRGIAEKKHLIVICKTTLDLKELKEADLDAFGNLESSDQVTYSTAKQQEGWKGLLR